MEETTLEPLSGKRKSTVRIKDKEKIKYGGKEKQRVRGTVSRGEREKEISLVERDFGPDTERIIETWKAFKAAGLPVVKTMRLTPEGKVMMTDLKADGSELYGKALGARLITPQQYEERKAKALDEYFFGLMNDDQSREAIRQQAKDYADLATKENLALAYEDAFELRINPQGDWSLICLDLEGASQTRSPKLRQMNQRYVDGFMGELALLNDRLRQMKSVADVREKA